MPLDDRQWARIGAETVDHLARLVRFDTSNPPGNETPAALYLKQVCEREGLRELQLLEAAPRRGNLVVRLRGDGSRPPFLLAAHLDVVPAEVSRWAQPPFQGMEADGMLWGRGTLDLKQMAAMCLVVLLEVKRRGLALKRDLIFAAVADKEMGSACGAGWLVENHPQLVQAEYGLNGPGAMLIPIDGLRCYPIQVAEKGSLRLRMRARGAPGEAALPHGDNALVHLGRALARLRDGRDMPLHVTPPAAAFIRTLAQGLGFPRGAALRLLTYPRLARTVLRRLPPDQRGHFRALLCNTVTPTGLRAGSNVGTVPGMAEADLDCRLLPGQTPASALREIAAIVGPGVEVEPIGSCAGVEFDTATELYGLLRRTLVAHDASALPLPYMAPWTSDARQFARLGVIMYGFAPGQLPPGFPYLRLLHGHDERIPLESLHFGVRVLWDVVTAFCC